MANSVDPDQTAPIGAVWSGSTLFASILNSSLMFGNYLQQTSSADDIFRCIFFLALLGLTFFNPCLANGFSRNIPYGVLEYETLSSAKYWFNPGRPIPT